MQTSPDWLRTVKVRLLQFDRDGVDVGMLLGNFQLQRDKTREGWRERGGWVGEGPKYVTTDETTITANNEPS